MAFSIPTSMSLESAQALLSKATHLTEGQRECALREYLEASQEETTPAQAYVKNDLPWTILSVGQSAADIEAAVKAGKMSISAALAAIGASAGGLKIRWNPKGTISVKRGGQWPWASLRRDQWESILTAADGIRSYIATHSSAIDKADKADKLAKSK